MRNSSRTGFTGCGKTPHTFCHSERSEESLFPFTGLNLGEILRSAQNDKIIYFFRRLKPVLLKANRLEPGNLALLGGVR